MIMKAISIKETFIDDTKTYSSIRDIPLPDDLIPIIKKIISLKKKDMLKLGNALIKKKSRLSILDRYRRIYRS